MKSLKRIFLSNIFCDEDKGCYRRKWRTADGHDLLIAVVVLVLSAIVIYAVSWRLC